jgi:hypothetical protein
MIMNKAPNLNLIFKLNKLADKFETKLAAGLSDIGSPTAKSDSGSGTAKDMTPKFNVSDAIDAVFNPAMELLGPSKRVAPTPEQAKNMFMNMASQLKSLFRSDDGAKTLAAVKFEELKSQPLFPAVKMFSNMVSDLFHEQTPGAWKPDPYADPTYSKENVMKVQKRLDEIGFPVGKAGPDGRFGFETKEAVENFQKHYGIKTRNPGELDAQTIKMLMDPKLPLPNDYLLQKQKTSLNNLATKFEKKYG